MRPRRPLARYTDAELRAELARRGAAAGVSVAVVSSREPASAVASLIDDAVGCIHAWRELAEEHRQMHVDAVDLAARAQRRLFAVTLARDELQRQLELRDDDELLAEAAASVAASEFEALGRIP
jgi:hypothetical protein